MSEQFVQPHHSTLSTSVNMEHAPRSDNTFFLLAHINSVIWMHFFQTISYHVTELDSWFSSDYLDLVFNTVRFHSDHSSQLWTAHAAWLFSYNSNGLDYSIKGSTLGRFFPSLDHSINIVQVKQPWTRMPTGAISVKHGNNKVNSDHFRSNHATWVTSTSSSLSVTRASFHCNVYHHIHQGARRFTSTY